MRSGFLLIFCLLYLGKIPAGAQSVRFKKIDANDGLPQNSVYAIEQDALGFLWFVTAEGLCRYDGYSIRVYGVNTKDSSGLASLAIRSIYADPEHKLWVTTMDAGLNCLDFRTGKFSYFTNDSLDLNSIPTNNLTDIVRFENRLFIGTMNKGVIEMDLENNSFRTLFDTAKGPLHNPVRSLELDKKRRLWIAGWGDGLIRYNLDNGSFEVFKNDGLPGNILTNHIRNVYADSKNRIWISHWSQGINVYYPETGRMLSSHDSSWLGKKLPYGLISEFLEDAAGNIWLASAESGAIVFNEKTGTVNTYMHNSFVPESISDNAVFSLKEDRSGLIWLGTWRGGISVYNPRQAAFGYYGHDPSDSSSIHHNNVYSIVQLRNGKIWVGTSEAISVYDPALHKFSRLDLNRPEKDKTLLHNSVIYCLYESSDGRIWIGTSGGGLFSFDQHTELFRFYPHSKKPNTLQASSSVDVQELDGKIYIATFGGGMSLYRPETDDFQTWDVVPGDPGSLSSSSVWDLLVHSSGKKLWAATSVGLNLFDPQTGKFKRYIPEENDSVSAAITTLFYDSKGRLWLCTDKGLAEFNEERSEFIPHSSFAEFLSYSLSSVLEDDNGNLWIGGTRGLAKYNPETKEVKVYSYSSGLQGTEFLPKAVLKTVNGTMYFGGLSGLNIFHPDAIRQNNYCPPVVITGFSVLNEMRKKNTDASFLKSVTLTYKETFFTFYFTVPEFSDPSSNTFLYRLDGFNDKWVDIGTSNQVTFTNLNPGIYQLHLKAKNSDGVESAETTVIEIIVTPPFWKTTWFYAICVLLIAGCIWLYIRIREHRLQNEKKLLELKVEERTVELKREKIKVEEAHKDIRDSIHYARRIQDAILPLNEDIRKHLPGSFVFYQPKDIVSGDFYWFTRLDKYLFIAVADCTGHGVPGAFMSMIGNTLLNEIVKQKKISEPAEILSHLDKGVAQALKQDHTNSESRDGMDIALVRITSENNRVREIIYAGANRPVLNVSGTIIREYKPDKFPIGGLNTINAKLFNQKNIEVIPGSFLYLFSDGYVDQFGGERGKKFKIKSLENILTSINGREASDQELVLKDSFESWKGNLEQVDDVLIIGFKI